MNRVNRKQISIFLALGLLLTSQFVASQEVVNCPTAKDFENFSLKKQDLYEAVSPGQRCCTANGFPYFQEGEWSVQTTFVKQGADTWALASRFFRGRSIKEALIELNNLFLQLPQPRVYTEMGHWVCDYGGKLSGRTVARISRKP